MKTQFTKFQFWVRCLQQTINLLKQSAECTVKTIKLRVTEVKSHQLMNDFERCLPPVSEVAIRRVVDVDITSCVNMTLSYARLAPTNILQKILIMKVELLITFIIHQLQIVKTKNPALQ